MLPSLKAAVALLSLLQLISSTSVTHLHKQMLLEITRQVRQLNSAVKVPCNDTRVAQVSFTSPEVKHPWRDRQKRHSKLFTLFLPQNCHLSNDTEIYLRHFLPALGNFTQGMYRRPRASAAQ
ncbi:hypothetical protein N305_08709 [Manacus vitellinus]|uniref:Interleukin-4 n=1 Tax=Manacus vitellinus TaxID=328815 RepID=A0A093PU59_9PASS|nr:hypothetical protein N305_08709 [Manacus vitellinus]